MFYGSGAVLLHTLAYAVARSIVGILYIDYRISCGKGSLYFGYFLCATGVSTGGQKKPPAFKSGELLIFILCYRFAGLTPLAGDAGGGKERGRTPATEQKVLQQ